VRKARRDLNTPGQLISERSPIMSKAEVLARHQATDEPFWRKPLPPIPGPGGSLRNAPEPTRVPSAVQARDETGPRVPQMIAQGRESQRDASVRLPLDAARPVNPYAAAKEAEHALDLARQEARECRDATLRSRTAFAKALADWNGSGPVMTQEQQAREFIRTSNEDRAARAAAGRGIRHAGVTRTAKAYAQGNQQRGGGRAYVRGPDGTKAYSQAEAMTLEANRLRIAAAAAAAKPRGQ
jgi:hypothetical protein